MRGSSILVLVLSLGLVFNTAAFAATAVSLPDVNPTLPESPEGSVCQIGEGSSFCNKITNNFNTAPTAAEKDPTNVNLDKASLNVSYCYQLKADDEGCKSELGFGISYTVMAAFCLIPCLYKGYGSVLEPVCAGASAAIALADMIDSSVVQTQATNYTSKAAGWINNSWGIPVGAMADALAQAAMLGVGIGTHVAVDGASVGTKATRAGSCVSAALNAVMAGIKFADYSTIDSSEHDQYKLMYQLANSKAYQRPGSTPSTFSFDESKSGGPASTRPSTGSQVKTLATQMNQNGNLGSSYATGALGKAFHTSPDDFNKAADALTQNTGITPGDLASSAATDGVTNALSKIAGGAGTAEGKAMQDALQKIDGIVKQYHDSEGGAQFASAATGGGAAKKSSNSSLDLSSLLGGRKPGSDTGNGGAASIKFGGFNNDIWHAGSTKSIFEIVSDKTHSVTERVAY